MYRQQYASRRDSMNALSSAFNHYHRQQIANSEQAWNYRQRTDPDFHSHSQRWKSLLLPQVDEKYRQIMRDHQGLSRRVRIQNDKSRVSRESRSGIKISQNNLDSIEQVQRMYEQKIRGLEQQNENLRQELFYLREALLVNFEMKNEKKEKERDKDKDNEQELDQRKN